MVERGTNMNVFQISKYLTFVVECIFKMFNMHIFQNGFNHIFNMVRTWQDEHIALAKM